MKSPVGSPVGPSRMPARLDLAQSLTGLVLAVFMWTHLILVASILLGKDAMYYVTGMMEAKFLTGGQHGFMKVARFAMDNRDKRSDSDWYEIIGNDEGVFGCMSLMGCEDNCPKDLPHQTKIAYLRRKMVRAAV